MLFLFYFTLNLNQWLIVFCSGWCQSKRSLTEEQNVKEKVEFAPRQKAIIRCLHYNQHILSGVLGCLWMVCLLVFLPCDAVAWNENTDKKLLHHALFALYYIEFFFFWFK